MQRADSKKMWINGNCMSTQVIGNCAVIVVRNILMKDFFDNKKLRFELKMDFRRISVVRIFDVRAQSSCTDCTLDCAKKGNALDEEALALHPSA